MPTHGTSSAVEMTAGQTKQLGALLLKQMPPTLSKYQAQYLIDHPNLVKDVLGDLEKPYRRLWKTIFVGYLKKQDFRKSPFVNIEAGSTAEDMFNKVTLSKKQAPVHLALATTKAITGRGSASLKRIYAGIKAFEGMPCEGEIGPYLREQYRAQPYYKRNSFGGSIFIAMDPMEHEGGGLVIFRLERDDSGYKGLKLKHAYVNWDELVFGPNELWVFRLPLATEKKPF